MKKSEALVKQTPESEKRTLSVNDFDLVNELENAREATDHLLEALTIVSDPDETRHEIAQALARLHMITVALRKMVVQS